jgi:uncharacterized protein (TIGR00297 family)
MPNLDMGHAWAFTPLRWATAAGVTMAFALLARAVRGVSNSGAVAGGLACLMLFVGAGPAAFAVLVGLFLMTWLSTRLDDAHKRELGLAERGEGRNGWQILANLVAAGLGSLFYGFSGNRAWLVATAAALAEAATDTVASEIGQSHGETAILITSWEVVPSGTDGGITHIGTLCGAAAGLILAAVAVLGGLVPRSRFWIPAIAGITGMFVDSLLGATCQRRGWMNNEAVNLGGSLAAAALAYALAVST